MTTYVVLLKHVVAAEHQKDADFREMWVAASPPVEAVSAEAAIRKAVKDKGGTYVAVPLRSWAPVTVTVETKRTLKLVENTAS